jgi:large conductance mechanosensitive channel
LAGGLGVIVSKKKKVRVETVKVTSQTAGSQVHPSKQVVVDFPPIKVPGFLQGFTDFVREQGVAGLAIGVVLGTQIKTLVDQLVASFITPLLGLLLPGGGNLVQKTFHMSFRGKEQDFAWGAFVAQFISFLAVAAIIYIAVKRLKLDKFDKKKE